MSDSDLASIVNDMYKTGAKHASGSTAAAIREEHLTGKPVGEKFHDIKGNEYVRALENWLSGHPTAAPGDRASAENIMRDLRDALGDKLRR